MQHDYDVLVVGGGAAGLSAAVTLLRSRRTALVLDAGHPRNAPAQGVHNLLGQEGVAPTDLLARGRAEVEAYGGEVRRAEATTARPLDDGFAVDLADGSTLTARRLVVTTGLTDELPDVPGVREHWGHDVLHCPYCHGWEVRDRALAVIGSSAGSAHQALLFSQLTDRVTLVTHGTTPDADTADLLAAAGVSVVDGPARSVESTDGAVSGVRLEDGLLVTADAVVVSPFMRANSTLLASLGVEVAVHPSGLGEHVPADESGRTSVAGVYVAGNVTDLSAQVVAAAAAGMRVGAMVNAELVTADARAKVAA